MWILFLWKKEWSQHSYKVKLFCKRTKQLWLEKNLLFVGLMCKILLGLREASTTSKEMPCSKLPVKWSLGIKGIPYL